MFFVYVAKDEVEYTVRYLDKTTGAPVVVDSVPTPDKVVKTRDAVVTETFKQITGYAPDAYQKLVAQRATGIPAYTLVSAENQSINIAIEEGTTAVKNVKTFYYT